MVDLIGRRLSNYEITGLLGEGGMATVYRARQLNVRRDVAIKIIEPRLARTVQFAKRFEREADTIASLNHAHILKLFDFGQDGELVYLVMELLEGGSLAELIRKGPLSLQQTSRYLSQIAAALDYAHSKGVIHRDLKPHNVLLDESGDVRLTDFGIAKVISETTSLTQTGAAMGTPAYMSPEQLRGIELDGRSDVYSLGIMVYEMLAGRVPFKGDTPMSMMYMHLNEAPTPIRNWRTDLPEAVQQVVNIALNKDRDRRFQTAGEFARAFQAAINGEAPDQPSLTADRTAPNSYVETSALPLNSKAQRRGSPALFVGLIGLIGLIAVALFFITRGNNNTAANDTTSSPSAPAVVMQVSSTASLPPTSTETPLSTWTPTPANPQTLIAGTFLARTLQPQQTFDALTLMAQQTIDAYTDTPTPDVISTSVALTDTAIAISLFTDTPTATATFTPSSTFTSTATATPTVTATLTATATRTLTPTSTQTPTPQAGDIRKLSNGIELVYVPAGCFMMGSAPSDRESSPDEKPQHKVCISKPYWIGRFEVTNGEYQQFIDDNGYFNRLFWSRVGWNWKLATLNSKPSDYADFGDPRQPRVGITWYEADAFARWAGGRLPTEAEWEYAARGSENWIFPWGNQYENGFANVYEIASGGTWKDVTTTVGSYPDGLSWVQAYDLSGNVWEWCSDWYDVHYYDQKIQDDPLGPASGSGRVQRGGAWSSYVFRARAAYRTTAAADTRNPFVGMRIIIDAN